MIPDNTDALLRRRPTAEALTAAGYPVRATTLATLAKRGGELRTVGDAGERSRPVLARYSLACVDRLLVVVGLATAGTGAIEKVVLLALFAACIYLAAKVSTFAARAQARLQRH